MMLKKPEGRRAAKAWQLKALCTVSGVALSMAIAPSAWAQDAEVQSEELDEIIVTGIRSSLENAQDFKRESDTVVDVITAEDIGALADRSVADALQRVPGVNVGRFQKTTDPDRYSVDGPGVGLVLIPIWRCLRKKW